jgi:hypothetical protein
MPPRPIKSRDEEEPARQHKPKEVNILDLIPNECRKCYYIDRCPEAHKSEHCSLISQTPVSIKGPADIQALQEELVKNAVTTLNKLEALQRLGFMDDANDLMSLRKSTFDLLEKLKRSAGSATPSTKSVKEVLGLDL